MVAGSSGIMGLQKAASEGVSRSLEQLSGVALAVMRLELGIGLPPSQTAGSIGLSKGLL